MSAAHVLQDRAGPRPSARLWPHGTPPCCRPCTLGHGTPARHPPGQPPGGSCGQILRKCGRCSLGAGSKVGIVLSQPLREVGPFPHGVPPFNLQSPAWAAWGLGS